MVKKQVYRKFLLRLGLEILVLEAAFLTLSWLLHQYWEILQRFSFADVLFVMSVLMGTMGSYGILRSPYWLSLSPWGVWASQVQATEDEKSAQIIDEAMHQKSVGLRLVAVGVITFLVSVVLTYFN